MNAKEIVVRAATIGDLPALLQLEIEAWPEGLRADETTYRSRLATFPDGIFIAEADSSILGAAVTQIISSELLQGDFSWAQITDQGTIKATHNPEGNCVYGVNLSVKPSHYGNGIVAAIERAITGMITERDLWMGAIGSRIPGFAKYVTKERKSGNNSDIDELAMYYIFAETSSNRALDPEIHIYRQCGLDVVRPLKDYFADPSSLNFGALIVWKNPKFAPLIPNEVLHLDTILV